MSSEVMTMQPAEGFAKEGNTTVLDMARRLENNARKAALKDRNGSICFSTSSPRSQMASSSPRMFVRSCSQPRVQGNTSPRAGVAGNTSPRAGYAEAKEKGELEKASWKAANSELEKSNNVFREENQRLQEELQRLRLSQSAEAMAAEAPAPPPVVPDHSEGRLRAAMTKKGHVTSTELRNAILGVEAMLDEAKRELRNAELREQRAAMEALYHAIEKSDEMDLEIAIHRARLAEVSEVDISKGEEKLRDLRSMTPEQKAAKLANELERVNKKEAYLLIKRDDPEALKALLDGLDPSVRWKDWRDYAGRTLWKNAIDLRARQQLEFLAPLVGQKVPEDPSRRRVSVDMAVRTPSSPELRPSLTSNSLPRPSLLSLGERKSSGRISILSSHSPKAAELTPHWQVSLLDEEQAGDGKSVHDSPVGTFFGDLAREDTAIPDSCMSPGAMSPSRYYDECDTVTAELRVKALRAVAQDDIYMLEEVLSVVHKDVWERWQNKAGKDLLTLSQERGSNSAYSLLARSMGILKEMEREAFEEREAVWVFEAGEVQPRRATVLEDTPAEEDLVYVEFWDGDEPPVRVDRCLVRKIN